jgi:hypothetical protein
VWSVPTLAGLAVIDAVAGSDAARPTGSGDRQVEREQEPRMVRVLPGYVTAAMEGRAAEARAVAVVRFVHVLRFYVLPPSPEFQRCRLDERDEQLL